MKYRFLITGANGSIGKYLLENLPDAHGLVRTNFSEVEQHSYDTIIHCAFNKALAIEDDRQYLEDNIFLTQRIIERLDFRSVVYLSSVDIYQEPPTPYSLCKRFSEALVKECRDYTILRCSTLLGPYLLKHNHLARMLANVESIGLSGDSSFNYILCRDLLDYFLSGEAERHHRDTIDFVAKRNLSLKQVKEIVGSSTSFGKFLYSAPSSYANPVYGFNGRFSNTSEKNLARFLAGHRTASVRGIPGVSGEASIGKPRAG